MTEPFSLQRFKELIDAESPHESTEQHLHWERVHEGIRTIFQDTSPQNRARGLGSALVRRLAFYKEDPQPYLGYAKSIEEATARSSGSEPTPHQWQAAIRYVAGVGRHLHAFDQSGEFVVRVYAREFAVAKAYGDLRELGYEVEEQGDDLVLTESAAMRLSLDIDRSVQVFGGRQLADFLFQLLVHLKTYVPAFQRWVLTRNGATLGQEFPEPQNPWGYILNIACKHFHVDGPGDAQDLDRILTLARLAVATTDTQAYSGIDGMFIDRMSLLQYLMEAVAFDSFISFEQFPAGDARMVLEHVTSQAIERGDPGDVQFLLVRDVALALLKGCEETVSTPVRASFLGQRLGRSQRNVRAVLGKFFSRRRVNQALKFPPLARETDMEDRPLIELDNGDYWCPPQSLCGKAMLEAVFGAMRERDENFDSRLGDQIESFLVAQARLAGVEVKTGRYKVGHPNQKKVEGQCDLVIESDAAVVFLEVKKKGLTRSARSGHDLHLLLDLTRGIAESQAQALRHQASLREFGQLIFSKKGHPSEVIEWKSRRIIRVSVVLFDYGILHDRVTLENFLRIACETEFSTKVSEYDEDMEDANEGLGKLREQVEALGEMSNDIPFLDSVLLSVPQFLLLLRNSSSGEEFVEELTRGERSRLSTKDFYSHYSFALTLPKKVQTRTP
jgi:hypothetical protein